MRENFIMLPTVDVCFAGLMENTKVRRGFVAAVLKVSPDEIKETYLLPTNLQRESPDDKLGILDVQILLMDGTLMNMEMQVKYFAYWDERVLFYISKMFVSQLKKGDPYENLQKCVHVSILDFIHFPEDDECYRTIHFRDDKTGNIYTDKMELQILELKKLPPGTGTGKDIVAWMRFFSGKSREEFESMAKTNEYLEEAYRTLIDLSADDIKRLEYEAREKALKDYNTQIGSAEKRGEIIGEKRGEIEGEKRGRIRGEEAGEHRAKQVFKLYMEGKSQEEIAGICNIPVEKVKQLLE